MSKHAVGIGSTFLAMLVAAVSSVRADDGFVGHWGLTLPNGAPGWLGVMDDDGKPAASILWAVGSVVPLDEAKLDGETLVLTRLHRSDQKDAAGKVTKVVTTETITATRDGPDNLKLVTQRKRPDGSVTEKQSFTGNRLPPLPSTPDLSKVRFGEPVQLFNGYNLDGWKLTDPKAVNGWSASNGVLINRAAQEKGKPHVNYGNLRTERDFNDFNVRLEVNVPKGGNSGVYLRGIYEVQVADTYGRPTNAHNMGGLYSRIKPTESAEKPAGEWQTLDITFVDRHVTVVLNERKVIDNQPVPGPTGGALWAGVTRPGPIYLQGDHTDVSYRNIILRPVVD